MKKISVMKKKDAQRFISCKLRGSCIYGSCFPSILTPGNKGDLSMYTYRELLKNLLAKLSQKDLDNLLNSEGLNSEFGEALSAFLKEPDVSDLLNNRFPLKSVPGVTSDTLKDAISRFLNRLDMKESLLYRDFMDKDHYYQIRDGKIKRPRSKKIFFRFAFILQLDYYETVYLLNLGGHIFSPSTSMYDYVIAHFICTKVYDFTKVNDALETFGLSPIDIDE